MGKVTGFLEFERNDRDYQPVEERIKHWHEFVLPLPEKEIREQAARCMDCGVPYCHGTSRITGAPTGCPVNNQIPDWNDLVYRGNWDEAARNLHSTNNFPEVTGRVCPAPCEASCTLNIDDNPVTIKTIECEIADRAIANGWVKPERYAAKTGKKVAVIGSGPAGMACAQQLARAGHDVHLYEKNAKAGGLLRYGIPDFKMEKHVIDRRVAQMEAEGVTFHYGAHVGVNLPAEKLLKDYDAVALTGGAEKARDLPIPGRELNGIHFAMDFLPQQNRRVSGEPLGDVEPILANDKHVVVIGGGDTGSDCIGTSIRQGAKSVTNFEIMPQPPEHENKPLTWPLWPLKLRTSSSHEEGVERDFAVLTQKFTGENGQVKKLHCVHADAKFKPIPGTEFELDADLVLLAMGFVHPVHEGMIKALGLELDPRGNVKADQIAYADLAAEGVRRRRHAPRPIARGVGDPRRPPMRPRHRQVPDGSDRAAAVTTAPGGAGQFIARKNEKKPGLRFGCCNCCCGVARGRWSAVFRAPGLAAATGRISEFGAATVVSGAGFITGIGSVVVATIGSVPTGAMARRGHLKSSARPAGEATASPLTSTRVTDLGAGGRRRYRGSRSAPAPWSPKRSAAPPDPRAGAPPARWASRRPAPAARSTAAPPARSPASSCGGFHARDNAQACARRPW